MAASGLRPLNQRTDLNAIADLIEVAFAEHMDSEGRDYIGYLRRLAKTNGNRFLFEGLDIYPTNMGGLVWIENDRLVGNLSLIPFNAENQHRMLIANVGVEPASRKKGIAKALTEKALQLAREEKIDSVWLHVREDNPVAIHLYESLGFKKRVTRSTWEIDPERIHPQDLPPNLHIQKRTSRDWAFQKPWLETTYPQEVTWNLALHISQFSPGFWNTMSRFFDEKVIEHWSLYGSGQLMGTITFEESPSSYDLLWLAADEKDESTVVENLVPTVISQIDGTKPLVLNYPAGRAEDTFEEIGFINLHRLIWMEYPLVNEK